MGSFQMQRMKPRPTRARLVLAAALAAPAPQTTDTVRVDADGSVHVWEGMFHGFYSNPDVPESREACNVMVDFFETHLGR